MKKILILLGPNLNLLGTREPEIYGYKTLPAIEDDCQLKAKELGFEIDVRQSNHEGVLIDWIQEARYDDIDGLIINAAAYTHTSIAIHDALKMLKCPIVEVHHSDPKTREDFRCISYIEPLAATVIAGHKEEGYLMALDYLADRV